MKSRGDALILNPGPSRRGWHRLQLAAECLQKFAWTYRIPAEDGGYTKKEKEQRPALARGSLLHLALAQHYMRMRESQQGGDPNKWVYPDEAVEMMARKDGVTQWAGDVIPTYEAYARHYIDDEDTWEIVEAETLKETTFGNGKWLLTGRMDLVVRGEDGLIYGCDHKCQPAGSRVLTPQGPQDVASLTEKDWTCLAWDGEKVVSAHAKAAVEAGVQDVYTIKFSDGTSERFGYRHPLLTEEGWKQADAIQEGDWVACARPSRQRASGLDVAFLYIMGLALSDGGRCTTRDSYVITAHDQRVRDALTAALDRMGSSWAYHVSKGKIEGVRVHTGYVREWLDNYGITQHLAADKQAPAVSWMLSDEEAGNLLGGLWDGDGSAYLGKPEKLGKQPVRLVYSSRSRALVEVVRHLLAQVGVLSNFCETSAVGSPYYQAVIAGRESKKRFLSLVGSNTIWAPATKLGGRKTRRGRTLPDYLTLLAAVDDQNTHPRGKEFPSADYPGRGRIKNPRWEGNIRWVKVMSSELTSQEMCYDIEVPEHHTFLTADRIVTHNTSARLTKKQTEFYPMSGQLIGYSHMLKEQYGDEFGGFILNLVQVGPEPKFHRLHLPRSPNLEARFERIVLDIEESIERLDAEGRPYDDWPKATNEMTCFGRYGACPFLSQCRFGKQAKKAGSFEVGDDW